MSIRTRITDQIRSKGPMPFERYMELTLYDAEGFYGRGRLRSAKAGDFMTSPEVSRLFGETLAVYVDQERRRIGEPFQLVEAGAGSGSLLRPLLETVAVPALAVEVSPAARRALASWVDTTEEAPETVRGVVIANELIDNLPMALAQMSGGEWRERRVGLDGWALVFVDADPRPEVAEWLMRFGGDAPEGAWGEAQLAAQDWLVRTLESLQAGSIVLIDYGDTAEGLHPRREGGTLRTYQSHHLGPHPLDEPGRADITADVNFSALIAAAEGRCSSVELHSQADFLSALGLEDRLSELAAAELEAARSGDEMRRLRLRALRTDAEALLHPRGLGDFKVLVITR